MSDWGVVFLGVIAVAAAVTAVLQIGLVLFLIRLARRFTALADDVEREIKPLLANANAVGRDAARATALVLTQVERADELVLGLAARVSETVSAVHKTLLNPAREGLALLAGLRAAIAVFRGLRGRSKDTRADDEDALFI
jgi:hypothetical protein